MTITGSTIEDNITANGGAFGSGGGILNGGTMSVSDSTITGNTSAGTAAASTTVRALTVTDCTIAGDSAGGSMAITAAASSTRNGDRDWQRDLWQLGRRWRRHRQRWDADPYRLYHSNNSTATAVGGGIINGFNNPVP